MRLALCAALVALLATITIAGCSDDDYGRSANTCDGNCDAGANTDGDTTD